MALGTLEEIYRAARQLPENQHAQLVVKLNGDLAEANGQSTPSASGPSDVAAEEPPPQKYTPDWLQFALEAARKIDEMGIKLPSDLAAEHDHYLYGTPKRRTRPEP